VARVLCDPTVPVERLRKALDGLDVVVELSGSPWGGEDVVALCSWEPVGSSDLERLPSLRVVATPSVGVDHLDVDAATDRGVWVSNVPDYCVAEMADHALSLLLALARGVVELDRSVRDGAWDHAAAGRLQRLSDLRLGIVGFGRIGRALAARASALGMEVWAHDPLLSDGDVAAAGVRPSALDDLLSSCTAVSVHAPLTSETRGLIGRREIDLLPEGAYVVNISRGGLLDTTALLEALRRGRLGGVALDVLEVEPPTGAAPAPEAPRLVVTPHAGWYSEHAEEAVVLRAAGSIRDVLEGRRPEGAVNHPAGR
jgi:D-3-phosphoglycerate dehydrogenase / 2-oxoglutarate reductase